jgi:hypothetical protein
MHAACGLDVDLGEIVAADGGFLGGA